MFQNSIRVLVLLSFLVGCSNDNPPTAGSNPPPSNNPAPPSPEIPVAFEPTPKDAEVAAEISELFTYQNHESRDRSQKKHYFLVAGGATEASFAQEIIDQRNHWIQMGIPSEQISCFYSRPTEEGYKEDKEQFLSLKDELKNCYPAYPKYLLEQIQDHEYEKEDTFYLYVTSHGANPPSQWLKRKDFSEKRRKVVEKVLETLPGIDQYFVAFDAWVDGSPLESFLDRVIKVAGKEAKLEEAFFTPSYLKQALQKNIQKGVRSYVVVQACYSGGFADALEEPHKSQSFSNQSNMTLMTAARYDRSSFGCDPGLDRTFFGEAYGSLLFELSKLPKDIDWPSLYLDVQKQIEVKEKEYFDSLKDEDDKKEFKPSLPMFLES